MLEQAAIFILRAAAWVWLAGSFLLAVFMATGNVQLSSIGQTLAMLVIVGAMLQGVLVWAVLWGLAAVVARNTDGPG